MATRWTDPTIVLVGLLPTVAGVAGTFGWGAFCAYNTLAEHGLETAMQAHSVCLSKAVAWMLVPSLIIYVLWNFVYHSGDGGVDTEKYIVFNTEALRKTYANRRIPMCELYELFVDGDLAFNPDCEGGDCFKVLQYHRNEFVNYKVTLRQVFWLLSQFQPFTGGLGHGNSSKKDIESTTKEIEEHYNRGNAFFHAFMGDAMVYTSGIFKSIPQFASDHGDYTKSANDLTLEQAQFNKMQAICDKLQLQEGETFLDIGCGWGTLVRHAAREYGAKATGVTLSQEGKKYCDATAAAESTPSEILHMDYRNIPKDRKFDKIASIEMAEHVGINNFVDPYLKNIRDRLPEDNGIFLMQVAGLRQGSDWEDVAWGLFMNKYIFPGADASTPLNWYIKQLELAGFEVHSVETIGRHYSHTLHKWYDNWMSRKAAILSGEIDAERDDLNGARLFRMWEFFLAYSVVASGQGSATCYQIVAHPNKKDYPRDRWVDGKEVNYMTDERAGNFDYAPGAVEVLGLNKDAKKSTKKKAAPKKNATSKAKATRAKTPVSARRRKSSSK